VLDPRFKLRVFSKTQDSEVLTKYARDETEKKFKAYSTKPTHATNEPAKKKLKSKWECDTDNAASNFDELDVYLKERTIPFDSDINCYWLANKLRFPTLAKMARDFLVSQPTTKDIEGGFSKGRRTIPYYRRRQDAETWRDQMLVNASYALFSRRSH
jgi:hypothetical protein